MPETGLTRPQPSEYDAYFETYVSKVPEAEVLPVLAAQGEELGRAMAAVGEEQAGFRYAIGKWSIKEVVGHLVDTERLMVYRALCFARGERQMLPGFDENAYMAGAEFDTVPLGELVEEFRLERGANLLFFRHLRPEGWRRSGTANSRALSVRALAYIMAGHVRHHLLVLRDRYHL
jgi:DinB superfamily